MNINLKNIGIEIEYNGNIERVFGYDIVQMNYIFSLLSEKTQQMWFDSYLDKHHIDEIAVIIKSKNYFEEYYKSIILPSLVNNEKYILFENTKAETIFRKFKNEKGN